MSDEVKPASGATAEPKPPWSWKRFLARRLVTVVVFYVMLGVASLFLADGMMFPGRRSYADTEEILKLATADGARISAVYLENPAATYTILYSHGNAEDIGDMRPYLEELKLQGFSVFAYDYRGYGTSEGKPSEKTTYLDVDAAFAHLTEKLNVPEGRIIAYGCSLGGGPSCDLASRRRLAGLVLQSTFVSAYRVVTHWKIFPWDAFENEKKLPGVKCPVLVMHGTADTLIKPWHGERLHEIANEPKLSLWVEGAGHNDLLMVAGPRVKEKLKEFAALLEKR